MPIHSRLGKKMELTIERLGINGEGVAHWYGCTIFVDGALPTETVQASLYEKKKNYGRAYVISKNNSASFRQNPICPLFGVCGGCQMMHMNYDAQLQAKRQRVVDALERIGKCKDIQVAECRPSPSELFYRNKIQIPVSSCDGVMHLGLFARNSHDVIDMQKCFIHCDLGQKVYETLKPMLIASGIEPFDPKQACGEIKYVLIKTSQKTNQVLVVLVGATKPSELMRSFALALQQKMKEIKGIVHCYNPESDNTVLSDSFEILEGDGFIEEQLCGMSFKISAPSFFQVNPQQAEALYERVVTLSQVQSSDTVLDAYCGVGTMSLLLAKHAQHVIGVEAVQRAIIDARGNALHNQIENIAFHAEKVEDFLSLYNEKVDIVILNPPRKGCELSVIEAVGNRDLKKIIYVSCDPATLARDLNLFSNKGWQVATVEPFDMFPQTAHVETLVSLVR